MTPTVSRSRSSGPSELRWSQLRAGAALLAVLILSLAAIFLSEVVARELSDDPAITVTADEARDLEPGSAVWVAGVPAGRVTAVRFREGGPGDREPIVIRAVLGEDAAAMLRADATARIRASALLAPAVLALEPGRAPGRLDLGDTLRAEPSLDSDEVRARMDSLVAVLEGLSPLADSLRRRLEEGPGTLAALRADPSLRRDLRRAGERARALAEAVPGGTAARLARDTAVSAALERTLDAARRLPKAAGAAGIDSLALRLGALLDRVDALGARLEAGRGTAGRLLNDRALERERRRAEAKMDSLRTELLLDPLRWLRFRLF